MNMPKLVAADNPILLEKAREVHMFGQAQKEYGERLVEAMRLYKGLGLAAPQVGWGSRIIAISGQLLWNGGEDFYMINPQIASHSISTEIMEEACLSLPGYSQLVNRYTEVAVRFQNWEGETLYMETKGMLARVIQHEIDHLDGLLINDTTPREYYT